jgi:tetratricopeptide (TPR) repeat protein
MEYKSVSCRKCGHKFDIASIVLSFGCNECGHIEYLDQKPPSPQPQLDESPLISTDRPEKSKIANLDRIDEAEGYFLQAEFILHSLQANLSVYNSNSAWSGAQPADVDLALKYLDRCIEIWPDNPKYLNLKALFLMEGKEDREGGMKLLEQAAKLAPDDITIQDNLEKSKKSDNCFIATAAYGSSDEWQVKFLRDWRDRVLLTNVLGRIFVKLYYAISPPLAEWIETKPRMRMIVRRYLTRFINQIR